MEYLDYILFLPGFVLLILGAKWLVDGSSSIAKHFNISDFIVGLTIVSFGTSMPELIVNIFASLKGNSDIAIGNVIGSNICNILLILGISSIIYPLPLQRSTIFSEIPFSLAAAMLLGFLANSEFFPEEIRMTISNLDGWILLFFFLLFMAYIFKLSKEDQDTQANEEEEVKKLGMGISAFFVVIGIASLFLGGEWVVNGAVTMAKSFGWSQQFIGLTIVAVGTSLPELVTSAMAAYKRNTDIAVGNVVGSNIFNILWILGCSAVINPLNFTASGNMDILVLLGATSLMIFALSIGRKNAIDRWNGIVFILLYALYIYYLVQRG